MNRLDTIIQNAFPTVVVPKYDDLIPCESGRTRLLMGSAGLYIETMQRWGHLRKQLWHSERKLPYGDVQEVDTFANIVTESWPILHEDIIPAAAHYAEQGKEWAGQIVLGPQGLRYFPLNFISDKVEVTYELPKLCDDEKYVVDVHSHGKMVPFFSPQDDEDDKGGVRIRMVLGDYRYIRESDTFFFQWALRYSVEGYFFNWRNNEN